MSLLQQLFWGSAFLGICAAIHVAMIGFFLPYMTKLDGFLLKHAPRFRSTTMAGSGFILIAISHTAEVWVWAKALMLRGVFTDLNEALYFSLVTFTTVGYGDITLGEGARIFGTFAGVSGVLTIGISTAFLVALMGKLVPKPLSDLK